MEFIDKKPKIYVLSGKAGTGKNKIASYICSYYGSKEKKCINLSYASFLKQYAVNVLGWDGNEETKPREFLQQIGVELIKNKIDKMMLVNRIVEDIKVYSYFYDVITISDARFPEEIDVIRNNFNNVKVIHIFGKENNLTDEQKKHSTEIGLDNYNNYDYSIDNSRSLNDLKQNIIDIVKEVEEHE